MEVRWLDEPEAHDYDAAADYLSLVGEHGAVDTTVLALREAEPVSRMAKDILRAADLALLPTSNPHVKADLKKIYAGKRPSPILLVRGYHQVCASYVTDENTSIPCRLVSWQA